MKYPNPLKISKLLLIWYLSIFISTEILSLFHLLERTFIVLVQIAVVFLIIFFNKQSFSTNKQSFLLDKQSFSTNDGKPSSSNKNNFFQAFKNINWQSKGFIIIFVIFLLTFIQGFFSAPSTTDSMVYHLPRVMYWIQEKTLDQAIIRNSHDFMPPFAEYILLHLYSISGNDRLLFFSQWLAYIVTVFLAGGIFLQLGGNKKNQMTVFLLAATLPIALLQSTSTQTDLVTSVLVLVSTSISLEIIKKFDLKNALWLGLSIGLGLLTKPTFVIYLLIPLGLVSLFAFKNSKKTLLLLVGLGIGLLFQLRYFLQNIYLYGSILGKHIENGTEVIYINEIINLQVIILNLIRNIFLQIPFLFLVSPMQESLKFIGIILGIDFNDSRVTWSNSLLAIKPVIYPQEDIVSNPLHMLLIIVMSGLLLRKDLRKKINSKVKILLFFLGFSFILFCALLKWQPYHPRLHLPFLLIGTILSVLVLSKLSVGKKILNAAAILSVILSFVLILFNVSRPYISYNFFYKYIQSFTLPLSSIPKSFLLKPRIEQYFNARHYWYEPYSNAVNIIPDNTTVAFQLIDDFEYPLWVLIRQKNSNTYVLAKNDTRKARYLIKQAFYYVVKSSDEIENLKGYELIKCEKTGVDYGYLCVYNLQN